VPVALNKSFFLFDIAADPTESINLLLSPDAAAHAAPLAELIALRAAVYGAPDTVGDISWTFHFNDNVGKNVDACMGPKVDNPFCAYGAEFACTVKGAVLSPPDVAHAPAPTTDAPACRAACLRDARCAWWQWVAPTKCTFKATRGSTGSAAPCPGGAACAYGPAVCPH
jgi:hypothetical protein